MLATARWQQRPGDFTRSDPVDVAAIAFDQLVIATVVKRRQGWPRVLCALRGRRRGLRQHRIVAAAQFLSVSPVSKVRSRIAGQRHRDTEVCRPQNITLNASPAPSAAGHLYDIQRSKLHTVRWLGRSKESSTCMLFEQGWLCVHARIRLSRCALKGSGIALNVNGKSKPRMK